MNTLLNVTYESKATPNKESGEDYNYALLYFKYSKTKEGISSTLTSRILASLSMAKLAKNYDDIIS